MNFLNKILNLLKPKVVVELGEGAQLPKYGSEKAAGADLYSPISETIPPRGKVMINTHVKVQLPKNHYLRIESRSGLAVKFSLEKGAGIIDEDYEGEVGIILYNHSDSPYHIVAGERIAQGVLQKYVQARFVQGQIKRKSKRGAGGFGSTGTK